MRSAASAQSFSSLSLTPAITVSTASSPSFLAQAAAPFRGATLCKKRRRWRNGVTRSSLRAVPAYRHSWITLQAAFARRQSLLSRIRDQDEYTAFELKNCRLLALPAGRPCGRLRPSAHRCPLKLYLRRLSNKSRVLRVASSAAVALASMRWCPGSSKLWVAPV